MKTLAGRMRSDPAQFPRPMSGQSPPVAWEGWGERAMMASRKIKQKQNGIRRLFQEQNGVCFYCRKPMLIARIPAGQVQPRNLATLDHIIPRSAGGANGPTLNCVAACHSCNNERGTKDARMFMLEKQGLA